jgi:hypothetical protein
MSRLIKYKHLKETHSTSVAHIPLIRWMGVPGGRGRGVGGGGRG